MSTGAAMGSELPSFLRVVLAEGPLTPPGGGSGEDQGALIQLINDTMTSWWAQAIAIGMYAAIALLLFRSLRRADDGSGPPVERRRARNVSLGVLVALGLLVVVSAALRPGPLVVVEYVILFAVLLYVIVRNLAPVVLGVGGAIMWALSPRRRRRMREASAARGGARERGAELERALDEALDDAREAGQTPGAPV